MVLKDYIILISLLLKIFFCQCWQGWQKKFFFANFFIIILLKFIIIFFANFANIGKKIGILEKNPVTLDDLK